MSIVDEFILQKFPHKSTGKLETTRPYKCRQCWFNNGFPNFKDLSKLCGASENSVRQYSHDYDWKGIRERASELQAQVDREEFRERQKEIEKIHAKDHECFRKDLEARRKYLRTELGLEDEEPSRHYTDEEIDELWDKYFKLRFQFHKLAIDERTNNHLTNTYKDTTPDELKIKQEGELKLKHHHENKVAELIDYEDYFKQLNERATELSETDGAGQ